MKNIYLAVVIVIALAVFVLGFAIFIAEVRSPEIAKPQVETPQLQTEGAEGSAGGVTGSPVAIPAGSPQATESATQP